MNLNGLTSEAWQFIPDHHEKLPQGIHLWYKGVPFPRRVYYDPNRDLNFFLRTLEALGNVKKYLFALTFLKDLVIPYRISVKRYEPFLHHIGTLIDWQLAEFWIKDNEFSIPVWEIGKLVRQFLENLGLDSLVARRYTRFIMMVLEFDNAYRYRVQDLLGLINELNRKNLKYIYGVYKQREGLLGASIKFDRIIQIFGLFLLIPKFSNALKKAHKGVDFNKIKLDDNDRYHVSFWRRYDFFGQNFETRYKVFLKAHPKDFPPYQKRDEGSINDFLTSQ